MKQLFSNDYKNNFSGNTCHISNVFSKCCSAYQILYKGYKNISVTFLIFLIIFVKSVGMHFTKSCRLIKKTLKIKDLQRSWPLNSASHKAPDTNSFLLTHKLHHSIS